MNENMELLNFVYENAEMGVHTLNNLSDILRKKDNKIKGLIEDELKEYNNFLKESEKLLKKNKLEHKKTNLMSKISSKMGIAMETMKDNSDPAIASMVIEGLTMGIVEMETKIESYKKIVDKKILKLSNKFLKFQEEEIEKLKTFM
ncbi:MAG: hypothetical protein MSH48_04960 [Mollicutes bacterium]|nr:hypothetical protein [Mollicutes bacterium]